MLSDIVLFRSILSTLTFHEMGNRSRTTHSFPTVIPFQQLHLIPKQGCESVYIQTSFQMVKDFTSPSPSLGASTVAPLSKAVFRLERKQAKEFISSSRFSGNHGANIPTDKIQESLLSTVIIYESMNIISWFSPEGRPEGALPCLPLTFQMISKFLSALSFRILSQVLGIPAEEAGKPTGRLKQYNQIKRKGEVFLRLSSYCIQLLGPGPQRMAESLLTECFAGHLSAAELCQRPKSNSAASADTHIHVCTHT